MKKEEKAKADTKKAEKSKNSRAKEKDKVGRKPDKITQKEIKFCEKYIECGNQAQAYIEAGYSAKDNKSASTLATRLLKNDRIINYLAELRAKTQKSSIATAQEVMEYFSDVMRGKVLDQFGLEASLAERTRAAMELARRTVDIENRAEGKADNKIEICLNWDRK